MALEILKWILGGIILIVFGYSVVRVLSKGIFKSFFEARSESNIKKEK
jgi:hypothetical protein